MSKFLNTTPVRTIVSLLLQPAAAFFIYQGYLLPAQITALASFTLAGMDVPKFSTFFQFILYCTGAVLIGQSVEFGSANPPVLTLATLLGASSILLRLVFYRSMVHTRFIWVDPLVFLLGVAGYFSANLAYHYSWPGWVFPAPAFLFSLKLIIAFIQEDKAYGEANKNGYAAKIGMPAPDFSLPDQDGNKITLSEFIGKRNVLLLFVRGDWCPACHVMLRMYERSREKFQEKNIFLLAVGPDPSGVNKKMAERIGVDYRILADDTHAITRMYGVYIEKDPVVRKKETEGLPLPASFLICDKGVVRYHSSPERVGEFLDSSLILDVLQKI